MANFVGGTASFNGGAGSGSLTIGYTVGSGSDRLLLFGWAMDSGGAVTAVTYNGAAMTSALSYAPTTDLEVAGAYRLVAPATGANNFSVTLTAYRSIVYSPADFDGVDQTTPVTTGTSDTGTGTSLTSTSNTVPAGGLAWALNLRNNYGADAPSGSGGTTIIGSASEASTTGCYLVTAYRTSTGTFNISWSASRLWDIRTLIINASGAAAAVTAADDRTGTRLNRPGRGPYSLGRYHIRTRLENFASTDVAQSLTGVAATGAVGTVTQTASFALTGNAGTSAVGIVTPSIAQVLTGVAATGAAGTAKSSSTCALTGNAATSAAGTVTASISQALTTVAGTGAVGTLVSGISYALTGLVATGAVGNVTANGAISFQLSGVAATGAPGALVPAISYAGSGNVATGVAGSVGAAPSYAVSGTAGTGSVGTLKSTITYPLTGSAGAGEAGSVGASSGADVSRALSGVAATAALGTLVANLSRGLAGISATAGVGSLTNPAEATFTADSRQRIGAASTAAASQRIGRSPT